MNGYTISSGLIIIFLEHISETGKKKGFDAPGNKKKSFRRMNFVWQRKLKKGRRIKISRAEERKLPGV